MALYVVSDFFFQYQKIKTTEFSLCDIRVFFVPFVVKN